jgi:predicted transcriptional regulator
MSKNFAKIKFENARKRLAEAFDLLEETVKQKIDEVAINNKMFDATQNDDDFEINSVQQVATINQLSNEINKLEERLEESEREIDLLSEKDLALSKKLNEIKNEAGNLITIIEKDLAIIDEVINKEE